MEMGGIGMRMWNGERGGMGIRTWNGDRVGMGMRIWSGRQGRYGNEVWSGARYHGNLDMRGVWWEYVVWGQGLYRNE